MRENIGFLNYFKVLEQKGIFINSNTMEELKQVSEMHRTIEVLSETLHNTRVLFERVTNVAMRIKPMLPEVNNKGVDGSIKKEPEGHLEKLQEQVERQMRNNEKMVAVVEHLENYAG